MSKTFKEHIIFPKTYEYSSDSEHMPLEFYEEAFPISKKIDLLLGYFSTNAIKALSMSLAEFIYNGGSMRLITNHFFSKDDYDFIINNEKEVSEEIINIFSDLSKLQKNLSPESKHFFDCLLYLKNQGRLEIRPVKFRGNSMSHSKIMILNDGRDTITTAGSINFTLSALLKNAEHFQVEVPWNGDLSKRRITGNVKKFNDIFNNSHPDYRHIGNDELIKVIDTIGKPKELHELLDDSYNLNGKDEISQKIVSIRNKRKLRFEEIIEQIQIIPKFPRNGLPRPYQITAYENWVKNNYKGIFGMATGTGKTKTSLICILNEYNKTQSYLSIILVPSIALLNQWEEEVLEFNFQNIIKVGGGNNWEKELSNFTSNYLAGIKKDLIIISTYNSFSTAKFQKYFKKIEKGFTLIADEAHNLGAKTIKKAIKDSTIERRIGLSATPKRIYDLEGSEFIDLFFKDKEPYTYSFSMKQALDEGYLTQYKYYPYLVELNDEELERYTDISKKLLRYFDFEKGSFKNDPVVEKLLLLRKNIIHKARNKISCFVEILNELKRMNKLKYIFCYIPEGYVYNEDRNAERILNQFLIAGNEAIPNLRMNSYIGDGQNLDEILRGFGDGKIDLLFAMKMLDEGVDIPRAEIGIFASSTGNPRQFIQRRGRLLRLHDDKPFATIFDMVVVPKLNDNNEELFNMERNLVKNELRRVSYFASLSMNFYDSRNNLEQVCRKYNLDLDTIINEL
ncbi:DEAD/DEAH box helicase family protein [Riemerella anatipestifer]|uniref:DEAD/DEAH box helicase family protein n=1 Tax=Riemerella anatipestifer TaxID=34085 RepID=UPI0012ADF809|nr:DEAD/DEAH box helicase family protein [Riemerella anatipestifer]USL94704.1 DEAD/DEAH box helicase family protein [Riemerella anatipestifer]